MALPRKHLSGIQYARALALFAVFAVHSSSTGVGGSGKDSLAFAFYNFFNIAGKIGTTTFIFLSSFILFYTYYHRDLTIKLFLQFYKKRLLYILVPYLVFSVFYFWLNTYLFGSFSDIPLLFETFMAKLATGKAGYHLYFVFVSVQFYLMFPVLLFLFKKFRWIRKYSIFLGIALQWAWVYLNSIYFQVPAKGSMAFSYFMFYFFGAFLGVYYENVMAWLADRRRSLPGIALLGASFAAMIYYYVNMMYEMRTGQTVFTTRQIEFAWSTHALLACAVIFLAAHFIDSKKLPTIKKILAELGTVSFGMYLIHPVFLMGMRGFLPSGDPLIFHSWQALSFLVAFFGSWFIVRTVFEFLPFSWVIFGKGNKLLKPNGQ
ncbi:peptidoglycan/LPS O-acetylase OafA/YrhL [Planomicrobium koreense]|uniref:Peptidoglycan/LPS O-acetylase OafA/YrhL n=1 Tax=Planococcus koreensis TaxID=112331 RepID=A0A7W8CPT6_9BACL|nr:acyltransferase [Planococcus koreensis]MBB5179412.1 peptidoglycan/LPS O-acetylase OafA/YrhL [Planococcus koreensis]